MSVPCLAQMGRLTANVAVGPDDAGRQILQFSRRMFVKEHGLYMHAWVRTWILIRRFIGRARMAGH